MIKASYIKYPLHFYRPAGTSRGKLIAKDSWFLSIKNENGQTGIGEVSFIPGLSLEDPGEIESSLSHVCEKLEDGRMDLSERLPKSPGIQFALESAAADLMNGGKRILYPSEFTEGKAGIPFNGLIWMGDRSYLTEQIREKMKSGFRVLKLKVGALEHQDELQVLSWIRTEYKSADLEIRLDANGAWSPELAPERIEAFARFSIHSIEQPIRAGQIDEMADICLNPPIPVALDEELIGVTEEKERISLMEKIRPSYIIIKPGLLGGFSEAEKWIAIARSDRPAGISGSGGTGWWITSALESNIGLNAIAQWTYTLGTDRTQGLGTGHLYKNNIPSPLETERNFLWSRPEKKWDITGITGP